MKYLLTVAINKYNGAALKGCVNDSNNMANLYRSKGYTVIQLLDEQATKNNIVDELVKLSNELVAGSTFIFHYSGHGSQIPSYDNTENDGLTEILCPFDLINEDGSWTNNYITDNELHYLFSTCRAGVFIETFFDCCHSGTITRDLKPDVRFRHLPTEIVEPVKLETKEIRTKNSVICFSAATDNQTAADAFINGTHQGAFTAAFLQSSGTRSERYVYILNYMKENGYTQTPQLTCEEQYLYLSLF